MGNPPEELPNASPPGAGNRSVRCAPDGLSTPSYGIACPPEGLFSGSYGTRTGPEGVSTIREGSGPDGGSSGGNRCIGVESAGVGIGPADRADVEP